MKKINEELWNKCVEFHGHECPGLTIGYRAALYATKLLNLKHSKDEEVVCVCETDACGVDAIQVITGCSAGKGNLLFHITGKQAFSFYERNTGKSVRLVLNPSQEKRTREESFEYFHTSEDEKLFTIKPTKITLPTPAKIFGSYVCDCCKETTGSNWIRLVGDKKVCIDCYEEYDRFHV